MELGGVAGLAGMVGGEGEGRQEEAEAAVHAVTMIAIAGGGGAVGEEDVLARELCPVVTTSSAWLHPCRTASPSLASLFGRMA
jgi:tellurite resistance protein